VCSSENFDIKWVRNEILVAKLKSKSPNGLLCFWNQFRTNSQPFRTRLEPFRSAPSPRKVIHILRLIWGLTIISLSLFLSLSFSLKICRPVGRSVAFCLAFVVENPKPKRVQQQKQLPQSILVEFLFKFSCKHKLNGNCRQILIN